MTKRKETTLEGKELEVIDAGANSESSYGEYPYRGPQVGEIVEFCWEDSDGDLHFQGAGVVEVLDRHIVSLRVQTHSQEPVAVEFSNRPRPNTWRFA